MAINYFMLVFDMEKTKSATDNSRQRTMEHFRHIKCARKIHCFTVFLHDDKKVWDFFLTQQLCFMFRIQINAQAHHSYSRTDAAIVSACKTF